MKALLCAAVLAACIMFVPAASACTTHGLGYRPEPKAIGKELPLRWVPVAGNGVAYRGIDPYWRVGRRGR